MSDDIVQDITTELSLFVSTLGSVEKMSGVFGSINSDMEIMGSLLSDVQIKSESLNDSISITNKVMNDMSQSINSLNRSNFSGIINSVDQLNESLNSATSNVDKTGNMSSSVSFDSEINDQIVQLNSNFEMLNDNILSISQSVNPLNDGLGDSNDALNGLNNTDLSDLKSELEKIKENTTDLKSNFLGLGISMKELIIGLATTMPLIDLAQTAREMSHLSARFGYGAESASELTREVVAVQSALGASNDEIINIAKSLAESYIKPNHELMSSMHMLNEVTGASVESLTGLASTLAMSGTVSSSTTSRIIRGFGNLTLATKDMEDLVGEVTNFMEAMRVSAGLTDKSALNISASWGVATQAVVDAGGSAKEAASLMNLFEDPLSNSNALMSMFGAGLNDIEKAMETGDFTSIFMNGRDQTREFIDQVQGLSPIMRKSFLEGRGMTMEMFSGLERMNQSLEESPEKYAKLFNEIKQGELLDSRFKDSQSNMIDGFNRFVKIFTGIYKQGVAPMFDAFSFGLNSVAEAFAPIQKELSTIDFGKSLGPLREFSSQIWEKEVKPALAQMYPAFREIRESISGSFDNLDGTTLGSTLTYIGQELGNIVRTAIDFSKAFVQFLVEPADQLTGVAQDISQTWGGVKVAFAATATVAKTLWEGTKFIISGFNRLNEATGGLMPTIAGLATGLWMVSKIPFVGSIGKMTMYLSNLVLTGMKFGTMKEIMTSGLKSISSSVLNASKSFLSFGVNFASSTSLFSNAKSTMISGISSISEKMKSMISGMNFSGINFSSISEKMKSMISGINFSGMIDKMKSGFVGLTSYLSGIDFSSGIKSNLSSVKNSALEVFGKISLSAKSLGSSLMTSLNPTGLFNSLKSSASSVPGMLQGLTTSSSKLMSGLSTSITSGIGLASTSFASLGSTIMGFGASLIAIPGIGWIIGGVAALTAGLYYLEKEFGVISGTIDYFGQMFGKVWEGISEAFSGMSSTLSEAFAPISSGIDEVMKAFEPLSGLFGETNGILDMMLSLGRGIGNVIAGSFKVAISAIEPFIDVMVGGFKIVASGISVITNSIAGFANVLSGIWNVLTLDFDAAGKSFSSAFESFGSAFESFGSLIKNTIGFAVDAIMMVPKAIVNALGTGLSVATDLIGKIFGYEGLGKSIEQGTDWVLDNVLNPSKWLEVGMNVGSSIVGAIGDAFMFLPNILADGFKAIYEFGAGISDWFLGLFSFEGSGITDGFIKGLKSGFESLIDWVSNIGSTVSNAIGGAFTGLKDSVLGWMKDGINDWVLSPINKVLESISYYINKIPFVEGVDLSIPMLAEGGIVDSPTQAIVGEAGPEAIIPLNSSVLNEIGKGIIVEPKFETVFDSKPKITDSIKKAKVGKIDSSLNDNVFKKADIIKNSTTISDQKIENKNINNVNSAESLELAEIKKLMQMLVQGNMQVVQAINSNGNKTNRSLKAQVDQAMLGSM
jgi:hypothetical protein